MLLATMVRFLIAIAALVLRAGQNMPQFCWASVAVYILYFVEVLDQVKRYLYIVPEVKVCT